MRHDASEVWGAPMMSRTIEIEWFNFYRHTPLGETNGCQTFRSEYLGSYSGRGFEKAFAVALSSHPDVSASELFGMSMGVGAVAD